MLPVIRGKVSSTSSKRDSKRTTCDDHRETFLLNTTYCAPKGSWETRGSNGRRNLKKAGNIKQYRILSNSNPLAVTKPVPRGGMIGMAFRSMSACAMLYRVSGFQGLFSHNAKSPAGRSESQTYCTAPSLSLRGM